MADKVFHPQDSDFPTQQGNQDDDPRAGQPDRRPPGPGQQGWAATGIHREAYKRRNAVERAFNKLCGSRGRPLREFVYKGTIDVATIRIWLRDPTLTHPRDTT